MKPTRLPTTHALEDEGAFRLRFLECRGQAFQDLFSEVMERAYPGDYLRMRPHGNEGDDKCDGYLQSTRHVFQVYAPEDFRNKSRLLRKIEADFTGALAIWQSQMERWSFVHNSEGLPAHALHLIERLRDENPGVKIQPWGYPEIRAVALPRPTATPRPARKALERYWRWLDERGRRRETAAHLAVLDEAQLPIRLIDPQASPTWPVQNEYALGPLVRTSVIWELAPADAEEHRQMDSHLRFYHMLRGVCVVFCSFGERQF